MPQAKRTHEDAAAVGVYDRDFVAWTQEQAAALREAAAGRPAPLDLDNLAEEIESLGKRDRRELASRIGTIVEHLLKLRFSPAAAPRASWKATVSRERHRVQLLLADSPSLVGTVEQVIAREEERAGPMVARELAERGEVAPSADLAVSGGTVRLTSRQVLEDWFPEPSFARRGEGPDQPGSV